MTPTTPRDLPNAAQDYARLWDESTARVLAKLCAAPFTAAPRSSAAATASEGDLWIRFKSSGRLQGELAFRLSRPDALLFAQLLLSQPPDPAVAFNDSHTGALGEVFKQFAGFVAASSKSAYGGETQLSLESAAQPGWKPAATAVWVFAAPQVGPLQWALWLSAELHASLESAPAPVSVSPSKAATAAVAVDGVPANLDLLLDVELEASLRFGQREMLLRDILELQPGSVVELNRRVEEPAELLVAGRVIAHGEVVIVDGNYGLRITDIAQADQRLESLDA